LPSTVQKQTNILRNVLAARTWQHSLGNTNSVFIVVLFFIYISLFHKNASCHRQFKNKRTFCKIMEARIWQHSFGSRNLAFVVVLLSIYVSLFHKNASCHRQLKSKRIFCKMFWQHKFDIRSCVIVYLCFSII